jgi:DnaK suppressor protein
LFYSAKKLGALGAPLDERGKQYSAVAPPPKIPFLVRRRLTRASAALTIFERTNWCTLESHLWRLKLSNLTPAVLSELDTLLRQRREEVLSHIRARLHDSDNPDQLALANHLEESGDTAAADLALLDHELAALREVDGALKRLADGQAGSCVECGVAIPAARLKASPTAQTCIACQEAIEKHRATPSHSII